MKPILIILFCVLCSGVSLIVGQPDQPQTITAETIGDLELGFVVRTGFCRDFSQDDRLLGNYDLRTGQPLFQINHYVGGSGLYDNISILQPDLVINLAAESQINGDRLYVRPDSNLLIIQRLGVFELISGRKQIDMHGWATLSEDGSLLEVPAVGIFRTGDGSLVLPLTEDVWSISPDNSVFAISGDGVYDLTTGERQFVISGVIPVFSPDSRWVATPIGGVYDVQNGEHVIIMSNNARSSIPQFSSDSRWLAIDHALYDMDTQEKVFDFQMINDVVNDTVFSPDNQLVVGANGVYVIPSGEQLFELRGTGINFNADSSLVASANGNIYNVETGEVARTMMGIPTFSPGGTLLSVNYDASADCFIYGLPDYPYPYRSGLVQPNTGVNIRRLPSTQSDVLRSTGDLLVVTAQTADHDWFKVFYDGTVGWVSANAVSVVEMPDGVPVENP